MQDDAAFCEKCGNRPELAHMPAPTSATGTFAKWANEKAMIAIIATIIVVVAILLILIGTNGQSRTNEHKGGGEIIITPIKR